MYRFNFVFMLSLHLIYLFTFFNNVFFLIVSLSNATSPINSMIVIMRPCQYSLLLLYSGAG